MVGQTCQNSLVLLHLEIISKVRRSFTPEDRYSIVQEAIRDGHAEVCRKYTGTGRPAFSLIATKVASKVFE